MNGTETEHAVTLLRRGKAPGRGEILHEISCGVDDLTNFLATHYLEQYIPEGGSKIKFLTGRPGAGKTHVLQLLADEAEAKGFLTVELSADEVWLHDFRELYLAVLKKLDLSTILHGCADEIVREMGYDPTQIGAGKTFLDFLAERREADAISKSTIRGLLRKRFTQNPLLDNCFAGCCSLLTGNLLGYPTLDTAERELIRACLYGEKGVKNGQLRAMGISPARITKYNARHLLRSLSELVHQGGFAGLFITVDDLERLLVSGTENSIRYTRTKRDDAYESIRQLIDDIDSMQHLMLVFAFDRELIDNENAGMKSYQALWMRIQNEVISVRVNCFADILDLDRVADQEYTEEVLQEMSQKLSDVLLRNGVQAIPLNREQAGTLEEAAQYGGLGLPYLVNRKTLAGGDDHV